MWSVDDIYLFLFTFAAKIVFFKFMKCGFFVKKKVYALCNCFLWCARGHYFTRKLVLFYYKEPMHW